MSIDQAVVEVVDRSDFGKGPSRRLRNKKMIPGVVYGKAVGSTALSMDPELLKKALQTEHGLNTVLTLRFTPSGKNRLVMLKDWQQNVVSSRLLHVDFVEIALDKPVKVNVPIEVTGKAKGVVDGGLMQIDRHELVVECLPTLIPTKIEVDVSSVGIGHSIHVQDLKLPDGVKAVFTKNFAIVGVVAPREEKVEVAASADAATSTAAPAADAKAAAPAAGAKAAAPAKDKK